MGSEASRKPTMTRISWQLIDIFSATLDPSEREAVLGDFAESGESGAKALYEVLGLVVRRQVAVWTAWRSWLTLTILIIPLGIFLSVLSRSTADESAVYAWIYANNWDWALVTNRGFWYVLSESATLVFAGWLVLVCWSWTTGFVLGYFSKGIVHVNRVLLLLALAVGEAVGAPAYMTYYLNYLYHHFHVPSPLNPNAPVFALTFYSAIFPIIIQVILVAGPAIYGIRAGVQMTGLRRSSRALFLSVAILTIATMIIQVPGLAFLLNANTQQQRLKLPEIIRAARFITYWPALYVLAMVIREHRNTRVIATQLL